MTEAKYRLFVSEDRRTHLLEERNAAGRFVTVAKYKKDIWPLLAEAEGVLEIRYERTVEGNTQLEHKHLTLPPLPGVLEFLRDALKL